MAYHLLSNALETLRAPARPRDAFATAVRHALAGYADMARYHRLGEAANDRGHVSETALSASIGDSAAIDLNPIGRCFFAATSLTGVHAIHRGIHRLERMTVKTEFAEEGGRLVLARRENSGADPSACRDVHLSAVDMIVARLPGNAGSAASRATHMDATTISAVADRLGLRHTAAADAAMAFETEPGLEVGAMARHLGCSPRTLQRELKANGVMANQIRLASMLNAATSMLRTSFTLTDIAHACGYADHAHMTRAFVAACGLPPSLLRQAFG